MIYVGHKSIKQLYLPVILIIIIRIIRKHVYTWLLNQFQWQTLIQRRTHSDVTIPAGPPYIIISNTTTRGHHLQLEQHHCRIASTSTSTSSSTATTTCRNNCHQTQLGLHRLINSRTDSPPSRWTMFYHHLTMHCFTSLY